MSPEPSLPLVRLRGDAQAPLPPALGERFLAADLTLDALPRAAADLPPHAVLLLQAGEDALPAVLSAKVASAGLADRPLIMLLEGSQALALEALRAGASDVCAPHDALRLTLILNRLEREALAERQRALRLQAHETERLALQASLDSLPCPIFFKDVQGVYRGCNRAFEGFLGLPRSQIVGATVYDVAPPALAKVYEDADRELFARGGEQIYEASVRYADGSRHEVTFYKAVFNGADGKPAGLAGAMLDITEHKRLEQELKTLAELDPLTGAPNRRSFFEQLRVMVGTAEHPTLALMVLDVDHFKQINDRFGHAAGDRALQVLVDEARKVLREDDVLARAGGEEFYLALPHTALLDAVPIAERLCRHLEALTVWNEAAVFSISVSIGVAEYHVGREPLESALARADAALYDAKASGRNRVVARQ